MNETLATVVLSLIGAVFSAKGWEYWQARQQNKKELDIQEREDTHLYRDDLRKEVTRLRTELQGVYIKREEELSKLAKEIADLRAELASFKTRVEFLEKENQELRDALEKKQ